MKVWRRTGVNGERVNAMRETGWYRRKLFGPCRQGGKLPAFYVERIGTYEVPILNTRDRLVLS